MSLISNVESVLALLVGGLLGLFYFSGLWWTVRQLGSSRHVALLFLCSMLFRTSAIVLGFYFFLGDSWQKILLGLLGFIVVRLLTTRFFLLKQKPQSLEEPSRSLEQRSGYAP